jgi:3-oxoadipate enol-lactonase
VTRRAHRISLSNNLRKIMTDSNSIATTRDGRRLAYRLLPGGKKARLALVHSLAMDGNFWSRVADFLREDADVLVYDCRGHGKSDKPAGPYTIGLFADDLADLLDTVGWRSAVVAGVSMGGCVTLAFAGAYPKRLDGLGLIDTTAWYGAAAAAQWEDRAQKARAEGLESLITFQKSRWLSDEFQAAHPEIVAEAVRVFLANDLAAYAETCRMLGHCDERQTLAKIAVPTRILVGADDYATPVAMAERLRDGIRGATLEVIPGVRHSTPVECPEIIARALRGLLVELGVS